MLGPSHGKDKRDAILGAALELFAERGYHGTAVPLVAERAGVGTGTIYRYFEDKQALVNALFRHWKRAAGAAVFTDLPDEVPPREQFHVLWERFGDFAERHPAALTFLEMHHHSDYLDEASRAVAEESMAAMADLLGRWRTLQVVKDLPPAVILGILAGAFNGLLCSCEKGGISPREALRLAEQPLWEAIRR